MKLIVFGPTGGVGLALVKLALARGHQVSAFARTPSKLAMTHDRLRIVQGDSFDARAVSAAIAGQEAVLCALGGGSLIKKDTVCSVGTRNILAGMAEHGVKRLITCTSMGVGDSRPHISFFVRLLLTHPLADKDIQERDIKASATDWVIVRPTGLVNSAARGALAVVEGQPVPVQRIAREDVAAFMLDQLSADTYLRRTPGISWKP